MDKKIVYVEYIDCVVPYKSNQLGELTLAYAMSVHKSQGSEYKCVITSAIKEDMGMLSRNTIYTAVTRAKQKCIVVTNGDTAKVACRRESGYERYTRLCKYIKMQEKKYLLLQQL